MCVPFMRACTRDTYTRCGRTPRTTAFQRTIIKTLNATVFTIDGFSRPPCTARVFGHGFVPSRRAQYACQTGVRQKCALDLSARPPAVRRSQTRLHDFYTATDEDLNNNGVVTTRSRKTVRRARTNE